jgi:hypothetical protein
MLWLAACYLAILLAPGLPFFGTQAVRLLRESWDGLIRADAKGNIRPVGATSLAEELFAMLDDSIPQTQTGPVTLNPDPGATALTINNPAPGDGIKINGGDLTFSGGGGIHLPEGSPLDIKGNGLTIDGSMNLNHGFYLWNGVPLGLGGGAGGTTTFLGKIISGTSDTYIVDLYGSGSGEDPTDRVTVTIPEIHPAEELPVGMWLNPIFQFTNGATVTYETQIPIWLS